MSNLKAIYEGWMVRYGRRKIGRSFIHMRYFVLETRLIAYYKKKPQANAVPLKTLLIDGNCRVEDRGLKTQHGFKVYVLCIYNKKEKSNRITEKYALCRPSEKIQVLLQRYSKMAAFNIQEALVWKAKIENAIDQQHQEAMASGNKAYTSFEYKPGFDNGRTASSSDRDSQCSPDDEDEAQPSVLPETIIQNNMEDEEHKTALLRGTVENGLPDSVPDWTREFDSGFSSQTNTDQAFSRKHWRLIRCENGLRIFEELVEVDYLPRSFSKAMKAVGVVDATCEEVFELVMTMDSTRFEWDCSFNHGSVVEEVDGHTTVLYHRLMLDWFPIDVNVTGGFFDPLRCAWFKPVVVRSCFGFVWPRDLCYVRYWRRNDDGSYVVLFRSRDHENCTQQPGYVRAHIESGGYKISPLKSRGGRPRTQVQNLMQIDMKGWGIGYFQSFQQHCVLQMLNSVAGLHEWFAQTDNDHTVQRIPVMVNMSSKSASLRKDQKALPVTVRPRPRLNHATSRHSVLNDEFSEEDGDFQIPETESEPEPVQEVDVTNLDVLTRSTVMVEGTSDELDFSCFTGNLRRDDRENSRDCWRISEAKNFKVRSKGFISDKSKVPAEKHLMELVAVDWFKDTKRMDHVARRNGCAVQVASERGMSSLAVNLQVPGTTHYSMVFYFVMKNLVAGSLLQRFFDGDDEFRNSRLKLIPSVPKGSWIVRQSVGSTPCILGKAVDITYIRGPKYLEIDVDIGSSAVANGVLGLVCGVITTLVVDMAFLVQANTIDELPEQLIGAVRVSHVELKSAVVPVLEENQPEGADQ